MGIKNILSKANVHTSRLTMFADCLKNLIIEKGLESCILEEFSMYKYLILGLSAPYFRPSLKRLFKKSVPKNYLIRINLGADVIWRNWHKLLIIAKLNPYQI